jgi:hypothetical protein
MRNLNHSSNWWGSDFWVLDQRSQYRQVGKSLDFRSFWHMRRMEWAGVTVERDLPEKPSPSYPSAVGKARGGEKRDEGAPHMQ